MLTEDEYVQMMQELLVEARVLMQTGEPDLWRNEEGFFAIMWPDDDSMERYGATRTEYRSALFEVFRAIQP